MTEENQELLVTMDDPGEDTLEEDTFHSQADNTTGHNSYDGSIREGHRAE